MMTFDPRAWRKLALVAAACLLLPTFAVRADDEKPAKEPAAKEPAAEESADKPADAPEDRYQVPETKDVAELVKFIDGLKAFRARTAEEFYAHRAKAPAAIQAAAERILELEKDNTDSDAYKKASLYLLESQVDSVGEATPAKQRELLDEVLAQLNGRELTVDDLRLGVNLARGVEGSKNYALAAEVYTQFGALFADHSEERLANYAQKLTGSARRMGLAGGGAIEIKGKLVDGSDFDWAPYKGKVVLVDYWATWCGPCIAELPNVLKQYELYHDKGFEVVGISLDSDREKLTKFVEERAIPWVQLFEDGAGWEHSMANYYGVMSIPTVILVDQMGTVVSMNARGPELAKQLEELLGPPPAAKDATDSAEKEKPADKAPGDAASDKKE